MYFSNSEEANTNLIAISASQIGFASLHLSTNRRFFSFLLRPAIHCFDPGYELSVELALLLPQQYRPSLRLDGLGLKTWVEMLMLGLPP